MFVGVDCFVYVCDDVCDGVLVFGVYVVEVGIVVGDVIHDVGVVLFLFWCIGLGVVLWLFWLVDVVVMMVDCMLMMWECLLFIVGLL